MRLIFIFVMKNTVSMYTDINSLLNDICKFLSETNFNAPTEATVRNLLERTKNQIKDISAILSNNTDNETGKYVDMQGNKKVCVEVAEYVDADENLCEDVEEYLDLPPKTTEIEIEKPIECPFLNLAVARIPAGGKSGVIMRKEKIFLFEIHRSFYAVIHDTWLLVYYNKKQTKPFETYDLKECEAKISEGRQNSFEFLSKSKSFTVITTSRKETIQWVAAINYKLKPLPLITQEMKLKNIMADDSDDLQIYEELEEVANKIEKVILSKPCLPPRQVECLPPKSDQVDQVYDEMMGNEEEIADSAESASKDIENTYDIVHPKADFKEFNERTEKIYELVVDDDKSGKKWKKKEPQSKSEKTSADRDFKNAFAPNFDTKKLRKKKDKYKLPQNLDK